MSCTLLRKYSFHDSLFGKCLFNWKWSRTSGGDLFTGLESSRADNNVHVCQKHHHSNTFTALHYNSAFCLLNLISEIWRYENTIQRVCYFKLRLKYNRTVHSELIIFLDLAIAFCSQNKTCCSIRSSEGKRRRNTIAFQKLL